MPMLYWMSPEDADALDLLSREAGLIQRGFFDGYFDRGTLLESIAVSRSAVWGRVFSESYHQAEVIDV